MLLVKTANKALQVTQKAAFVLCITLRSIVAQNKGRFLGHLNLALYPKAIKVLERTFINEVIGSSFVS